MTECSKKAQVSERKLVSAERPDGTFEPIKDGLSKFGTGNAQRLYRFPNGFGASVIQGAFTYGGSEGCWELGVGHWTNEGHEWHLDHDTPITSDVIGYLDEGEVLALLREIRDLPPRPSCGKCGEKRRG